MIQERYRVRRRVVVAVVIASAILAICLYLRDLRVAEMPLTRDPMATELAEPSPQGGSPIMPAISREGAPLVTRDSDSGNSEKYKTESELAAAHLAPAPAALQAEAQRLFLTQASEYEKRLQQLSQTTHDWASALEELDARFQLRLRRLAIEVLGRNLGLLIVGGQDYQKRVGESKFLIWTDGRKMFDRNTDVLVAIDPPDAELEELDRQYWNTRATQLAETLIPFNGLPKDERWDKIKMFLDSRKAGKADGSIFGVTNDSLRYLGIDNREMVVTPVFR